MNRRNGAPEVIRIDPEVWRAIKRLAGKFETPNEVIRRALGLGPKEISKKSRKRTCNG